MKWALIFIAMITTEDQRDFNQSVVISSHATKAQCTQAGNLLFADANPEAIARNTWPNKKFVFAKTAFICAADYEKYRGK